MIKLLKTIWKNIKKEIKIVVDSHWVVCTAVQSSNVFTNVYSCQLFKDANEISPFQIVLKKA